MKIFHNLEIKSHNRVFAVKLDGFLLKGVTEYSLRHTERNRTELTLKLFVGDLNFDKEKNKGNFSTTEFGGEHIPPLPEGTEICKILNLNVDTDAFNSELDKAIEKASQLKSLVEEVKSSANSLSVGPVVNVKPVNLNSDEVISEITIRLREALLGLSK